MLYILRHGKTDWNEQKRAQGRTDIPLNEEGRKMAREAASLYRDVPFDVCLVSPLLRAKETAKILLEGRRVPIVEEDLLKEMCFGASEGDASWREDPGSPLYHFFHTPWDYVPDEGGETFQEVFARVDALLENRVYPLVKEGKNVLIVGHGAMNSAIALRVRGWDLHQFWQTGIPNCRLITLMDEKGRITEESKAGEACTEYIS